MKLLQFLFLAPSASPKPLIIQMPSAGSDLTYQRNLCATFHPGVIWPQCYSHGAVLFLPVNSHFIFCSQITAWFSFHASVSPHNFFIHSQLFSYFFQIHSERAILQSKHLPWLGINTVLWYTYILNLGNTVVKAVPQKSICLHFRDTLVI